MGASALTCQKSVPGAGLAVEVRRALVGAGVLGGSAAVEVPATRRST